MTEPKSVVSDAPVRRTFDAVVMLAGFLASAAVVLWQNLRLTVLWDLSYILENATRIAAGDVPYRDFPFPYAPLTFVGQALIIRLFGRAEWHHTAYAACAGGLATVLAYRVLRSYVSRVAAIVLLLPLVPLGIYAIFPHPFYDPDACLLALIIMAALLTAESRGARFTIGIAAVLMIFVKQNIGIAFLAAIAGLAILARNRRMSMPLLGGIAAGLAAAFAVVAGVFGIGNYIRWTVRFAASRRLPSVEQYTGIYSDEVIWWWVLWIAIGTVGLLSVRRVGVRSLASIPRRAFAALQWLGVAIIVVPFVWSIYRIYATDDPTEREVNLLRFWPALIVCGFAAGLVWLWRERGPRAVVPLLAIATIAGAFLSQSDWGSTYGVWPMLVIAAAAAVALVAGGEAKIETALAIAITGAFLFGGIPYVVDNERLTYVKLNGALQRSNLPPLRGMSEAGEWLPEFEQLVAWTSVHIPRGDGILCLPGEDLFYFTTGRRPQFPVLMFDRTVNPYDAATIARLADERHIRWVIVKQRLQLNGTPMESFRATMDLLETKFGRIAELANYTIYERM